MTTSENTWQPGPHEDAIERLYGLLGRGFEYLFQAASSQGHWHEARSTALAGMCLGLRESGDSPWLRSVRAWIEKTQLKNGVAQAGSWGEEVWDTAMCVLALMSLGAPSRAPAVARALEWIGSLYSESGRNNWHDEPWETSWALLAILTSGRPVPKVDVVDPILWLSNLQDADGKIIAPHYTAYFVLIHQRYLWKFDVDEASKNQIAEASRRASAHLISSLDTVAPQTLWTGEAWSNGQILWALTEARSFPAGNAALVQKAIRWFETSQAENGMWTDVEDTASALLGLFGVLVLLSDMRESGSSRHADELLRKRAPAPRLRTRRHFDISIDSDSGDISISISRRMMAIIVGLLTLTGGIVTALEHFETLRSLLRP